MYILKNLISKDLLKNYDLTNYNLDHKFKHKLYAVFKDKNNFSFKLRLPQCYKKLTTELNLHNAVNKNEYFKYLANLKHNNKYNYNKINYINSTNKLKIICDKHGEFEQSANSHLSGSGCIKCKNNITYDNNLNIYKNIFIEKSIKIHGNKYNYDSIIYKTARTHINILCKEHGIFSQIPYVHTGGSGCPKCNIYIPWTRSGWIENCKNEISTLYVVKFYNKNEKFIKIGITNRSLNIRLKEMPYKHKILFIINNKPEIIWYLEKAIHDNLKNYKYMSKIKFEGNTECFSIESLEKFDKDQLKNYIEKLLMQERDITKLIKKHPNEAELGYVIKKLYT